MLQQLRVSSSGNTQLVSVQLYYGLVVRLVSRPRQCQRYVLLLPVQSSRCGGYNAASYRSKTSNSTSRNLG